MWEYLFYKTIIQKRQKPDIWKWSLNWFECVFVLRPLSFQWFSYRGSRTRTLSSAINVCFFTKVPVSNQKKKKKKGTKAESTRVRMRAGFHTFRLENTKNVRLKKKLFIFQRFENLNPKLVHFLWWK